MKEKALSTSGLFRKTSLLICCLSYFIRVATCGWGMADLNSANDQNTAGPLFHKAEKQFKTMRSTLYQYRTQVDVQAGSYRYDCVGFVSYALKQAAPEARASAFRALEIKPGRIPSPAKYMNFFASLAENPQPGWQAINKASELRPGDIVAWERKTSTATGHAVIIASIPLEKSKGLWVVKIYDSTSSPHAEDSRPHDPRAEVLGSNGKRSGLGHGMMAFIADPVTGDLTGYCWGPRSKPVNVPIKAGRPTS